MIHRLRISSIFVFTVFSVLVSKAQNFHFVAMLDSVKKTGFYALECTPELSTYLKSDFSDLRVTDEFGKPVPYIRKSYLPILKPDYFRSFRIINNQLTDSGQSVLTIANDEPQLLGSLSLHIRNNAVSRTVDISGSDDLQHWYTVIEHIGLGNRLTFDSGNYVVNVEFPEVRYKYFRIVIYNGKNDPLQIVSVGKLLSGETVPVLPVISNPSVAFSQKDSIDHFTYLFIFNPRRYHISHIDVRTESPRYFHRHAELLNSDMILGAYEMFSDSIVHFAFPVVNDSSLVIKIYNGENPALKISRISTGQDGEKIIAYLEQGKKYQMQMGNQKAILPHYDLEDFKDSIPSILSSIGFSSVRPISEITKPEGKQLFRQTWVWPIMIAVLLSLIFFTFRLTSELKKSSNELKH